ncbi:hypothetical protein THRCLA_08724 [Thraustotheca clavata]|uniref:Phospholipid-transporting ATPase n=1 Tax=Thraustotheca clavata TaxID=74557 RepID=A0A1V9Z315_9STRA|nr:hypothetical protein THRCLA_08724 [Thraustotheca clavata]
MWQEIDAGDIVKICEYEAFPADMLLVQSSHDNFTAYIDASNLNGQAEFNVKECLTIKSKALANPFEYGTSVTADIHCHSPSRDLTLFNGILSLSSQELIEETPFTSTQIVLRGTRLINTAFVIGIVVAAGNDTKLMQNHRLYSNKCSQVDYLIDRCVDITFLLLVILTFASAIKGYLCQANLVSVKYLALNDGTMTFLSIWLTHFVLYSYMIPISLYVSIEIIKWCQAIQMERDINSETKGLMRTQTSKLNPDLGRINYIFTDKTGTLTKNEMKYQQNTLEPEYLDVNDFVKLAHEKQDENIQDMFRCILLCHNASILQSSNIISCSPDEVALLTAASDFNCSFNGRAGPHIQIVVFGELEIYTLLACNEFDSYRKCMSVVVQRSYDGAIIMYCKGADSVLLSSSKESKNLQSFAMSGLRTLVFASKRLSSIDAWLDEYNAANTASNNREQALRSVAMKLEQIGQMNILGCTGIQDTLQEGVSASIRLLTKAGLRLWMLTGDKQETSIATAYACGLLNSSTNVLTINGINQRECLEQIAQYRKKLKRDGHWLPGTLNPFMSIVIHGKALQFLLPEQCLQKPSRTYIIRRYASRAVSEQQVVVGANAHEMVDYYVALSEILVLRHNQSLQIAKDMAASRFNRWLASPEGSQRIRSEAIRILEEANNAKAKLPTKREAEQQARDHLQSLHHEREDKRKPAITPFLEEATELCTKIWSMEEEK